LLQLTYVDTGEDSVHLKFLYIRKRND